MTSQKLRIYHFTPWYPNPGDPQLGIFVSKHIRALLPYTHSSIATFYRPSERKSGIIPHTIEGVPESTQWEVHGAAWRFALKLGMDFFSRRKRVDVLHLHVLDRYGCLLATIARICRIPIVITEHWTGYRKGLFNEWAGWERTWRLKCMAWARAITVVSPSLQEDLTNLGVRTPIHIIPNILEPAKKIKAAYQSPIKWVIVADLVDDQKNVSGVLEAFNSQIGPGEELHIIGDGPDREMLEFQAQNPNIFFHGRWDNSRVLEEIDNFDVLLVNSNVETFSVITAEALSAGLTCIVTRSGGPEYIVNSTNGLIVEPKNKRALTEAMQAMRANLHTDYEPSKIAHAIRSQFHSESIGRLFVSVYHDR